MDWTRPETWPSEVSFADFPSDFRALLRDHTSCLPAYKIIHVRLDDVVVDPIDYDDDRDFNADTGEPSDAYVEGLVDSMKAGDKSIPPIVVGDVDPSSPKRWGFPFDGRHRLNAATRLGLSTIPAIDVSGLWIWG